MALTPVSNNEFIVRAVCSEVLTDFKKWMVADTKPLQDWKSRPKSIKKVSGRLVDDFEDFIKQWRTKSQDNLLPVMICAVATVAMPPDVGQIRGIPNFRLGIIPTDPQQRHIKFRAMPQALRVQFAFLSPDQDSVSSLLNQFSFYMQDDFKRRFKVKYKLAPDVESEWDMTVFDNSLFPDTNRIQDNLEVGIMDFTIAGLVPHVVGLNLDGNTSDNGQVFYPDRNVDPDNRNPTENGEFDLVVEADLFTEALAERQLRAKADKATLESTVERLD
ncbi:hypothetical protein [Acinetobacter venetianus]|uniref:hypothetical protein n=1 Tax=Acinetobacter venetianus TaxID=52133 RepID=UPI003A8FCF62